MGQVHNELTRGPWGHAVKAALGDSKGETALERWGETLQPVMDIWAAQQYEWRFLREERQCAAGASIAAGAATFVGSFCLVNPAGSNMLVIVERATLSLPANATWRVGTDTEASVISAGLATNTVGAVIDTRWTQRGVNNSRAAVRFGSFNGNLGVTLENHNSLSNTYIECLAARGVVLSPGFALCLQSGDDAAIFNAAMSWRERQGFKNELVS